MGMNALGETRPFFGMIPAQQGFKADNFTAANIILDLVVELELIASERTLQIHSQFGVSAACLIRRRLKVQILHWPRSLAFHADVNVDRVEIAAGILSYWSWAGQSDAS